MRLLQIQYFLKIAETGSFTQAAQQLYLSQPALSKQMALLEEEIGTPLVRRTSRGIQLTPAGESFAEDCSRILRELETAVEKAADIGNAHPKVLRLGCFDGAVIDDFMPALFQHIRSFASGVDIQLSRRAPGVNQRMLKNGSIDLMIDLQAPSTYEDIWDQSYQHKLLTHRTGALIYSRLSPLAQKQNLQISDFASQILLIPNSKDNLHLSGDSIASIRALGIDDPIVKNMDNFMTMLTNVKMGYGYCILSKQVIETNPDLMAYDIPDHLGIDVVAIWKKDNLFVSALMDSMVP